jgi:hypothetical protein
LRIVPTSIDPDAAESALDDRALDTCATASITGNVLYEGSGLVLTPLGVFASSSHPRDDVSNLLIRLGNLHHTHARARARERKERETLCGYVYAESFVMRVRQMP